MAKNLIRKVISGSGTFTVPAGVENIIVTKSYGFAINKNSLFFGSKGNHFGVLKSDGSAWTWGRNDIGQLGDNTRVGKSSPVAVVGGHNFIKIAGGFQYTLALKENGEAWAWGGNQDGQLGDGTISFKSSPVQVVGGHSFIDITCGSVTSYGLKTDGSMWAWGNNLSGELGDGTIASKSSPVAVIGGHSFIAIASSSFSLGISAFGLKSDGSIWAWGKNTYGNLGDNTIVPKSSPVQVVGGHSFIAIHGGLNLIALKSDGSAWNWGINDKGQLGDGTLVAKSSPVAVIGGHSFISIAYGVDTGHGLKSDGSAWSWGYGTYGQLGDGTTVAKSSPVAVIGGHSFMFIAAGGGQSQYGHGHAIKADGTVWSWGDNFELQIGDGDSSISARSSPVAVIGGSYGDRQSAGNYYYLNVNPNDQIPYGNGYFGLVRINGPWLIQYEA